MEIRVVCENCNQPFVCWRRRRFCSRTCAAEYRSSSSGGMRKPRKKRRRQRSIKCPVCGGKFAGITGEVCSPECRSGVTEGDDPIETIVKWVESLLGTVSGDDWLIVGTLYREDRPLKAFEIAYSARWPDKHRWLMDESLARLLNVGVISEMRVCDAVVKYTLNPPPNVSDFKKLNKRGSGVQGR